MPRMWHPAFSAYVFLDAVYYRAKIRALMALNHLAAAFMGGF
ncbi:hypothetical protein ACFFGV_17540 [Pontibacillus salicampi]|uniref:Uncharacterized protein n=1 Tax=Pontibacillus salicampi TaxID=1449801 RepID=A0ABV6LSK6_9BACI